MKKQPGQDGLRLHRESQVRRKRSANLLMPKHGSVDSSVVFQCGPLLALMQCMFLTSPLRWSDLRMEHGAASVVLSHPGPGLAHPLWSPGHEEWFQLIQIMARGCS